MKFLVKEIAHAEELSHQPDLQSTFLLFKNIYGAELKFFILTDKGNNPVGHFCIYAFNKLWQKHQITPPFLTDIQLTTQCKAENSAQVTTFYRDIVTAIVQFLKTQPHTYLELVFPESYKDLLPFVWNEYKVGVKYSYFIDLGLSEEELLQNMSTQRRKNIRDAEKLNLEIKRVSDPTIIYDKAIETLSSKNAKFNPDLVKSLSNLAGTAHLISTGLFENGKLVALSTCLRTTSECTYLFGWNSTEKGKSFYGTYALWNCILACKESSVSFNFAGSQIPSVEKYFRGFGGQLTPLLSVVSDKRKLTKQFS